MINLTYLIKRLTPVWVVVFLITLNFFAYQYSKNYFTSENKGIEVEEMTESEQGDFESNRFLIWTYEFFKSFRKAYA